MSWKDLFLSANGRVGQGAFWIGFLILVGAWVVSHLFLVLAPVIWLALLYPWVCLFAKRLHDFGRSGWLILVPFVVAVVAVTCAFVFGGIGAMGTIWTIATEGEEPSAWATAISGMGAMLGFLAVAGLVKVAFILWVGLSKGADGPNAYGPPAGPLGAAPPAAPAA